MFGASLFSPEMTALGDRYKLPTSWQFVLRAQMEGRLARECWRETEARWQKEKSRVEIVSL